MRKLSDLVRDQNPLMIERDRLDEETGLWERIA